MSAEQLDQRVAYGFLRVIFGVNICFHGLSRLLGDHAAFLAYLNQSMAHAVLIPKAAIPPFAAVLPWLEAITGLLLLLGLFTRFALFLGFVVMFFLMVGVTLAQNWDVAGVQLIYCVIYFALLSFRDRNFFSVDNFLARSKVSAR